MAEKVSDIAWAVASAPSASVTSMLVTPDTSSASRTAVTAAAELSNWILLLPVPATMMSPSSKPVVPSKMNVSSPEPVV